MNESATVRIFLVKGSPTSIRTAEISNWTGKAVAGPRSQIEDILKRDESGKPGVYFLTGVNPESGKDRVYIGEAEVIRNRIKGHLEREFWKTVVFFVSKDENLTKAHIKYFGTMNKKKADVCPDLTIGYDNISSKIERRRYYEYRPIKSTIS